MEEKKFGIYIHIPFCKAKCTYCDFTSFANRSDVAEAYMACVYKEIELRAKQVKELPVRYLVDTIYFGGGTPSVVDPAYIYGAVNQIKKHFPLTKNPEITIEMNPGTVSEKKIETYRRAGINRFSIGLQTAIDTQLKELGRIHNVHDYLYAATLLKGENFSADIMLGLKGQTKEDVQKTVELAFLSGAKHISMYALTPEEGTPIYTDYLNGELPDGDEVRALYDYGYALLKERGYARYEVSNFAQKGFESRHNLNYWARGEYLGFGVSASSFFGGRRFTDTLHLDDYIKCILSGFLPVVVNDEVTDGDAKFEFVMLALRTAKGISSEKYRRAFGSDWKEDFAAPYKKMHACFEQSGGYTRIKEEYLYVQNQILTEFLR